MTDHSLDLNAFPLPLFSAPSSQAPPASGGDPRRDPAADSDPTFPVSSLSSSKWHGLDKYMARPKTSHSRLQPIEEVEPPPRIPHAVHAKDNNIVAPESPNTHHQPSATASALGASPGLSSHSSAGSLGSQASDASPRKKRKRFLPFKAKFIGAWKENVSAPASDTAPTAAAAAAEQTDMPSLTQQLDELPADLKPAAARRLGIGIQDRKSSSRPRYAFVARTGASSVVHSRAQSQSSIIDTRLSQGVMSDASGQVVANDAVPPLNDNLGASPAPANDTYHEDSETSPHAHQHDTQNTFYASSSDSEDEPTDYDKYSSGYSCGSSETSYNISSPATTEVRRLPDYSSFLAQNSLIFKDAVYSSPVRHSQNSASSSGSYSVNTVATNASKPASAARQPARPLPQQSLDCSISESSTSRVIVGDSQPPSSSARDSSLRRLSEVSSVASAQSVSSLTKPASPATESRNRSASIELKAARARLKPVSSGNTSLAGQKQLQGTENHITPKTRALNIPAADRKSARPLSLAMLKMSEAVISADSAEAVILRIFETIDNFQDLYACARLNKGFYQVFKRNELRLMKNTLQNLSPAQWEHREASPKEIVSTTAGRRSEYTPTSYVQFQKRDGLILAGLKSMVLARCQTLLRSQTVKALSECDPIRSARVDDAFWRAWTFCLLFGPDSGREHDITAQLDWLRGGQVAHRPNSVPRNSTGSSDKSNATLLYANESFGRGNYGGLTVDELYDLIEVWNCIKALLQGIKGEGRFVQARAHGVYDGHYVHEGDVAAEKHFLDEWIQYIVALGPSVVFDLATHSISSTDEVFAVAASMEWTSWKMPELANSRSGFLLDPVTRLYKEKQAKTSQMTLEQVQAKRRSRSHELAAELRVEKRRSVKPFGLEHDQSIDLWLEWMARAEGVKTQKVTQTPMEPIKETEKGVETPTAEPSASTSVTRQPHNTQEATNAEHCPKQVSRPRKASCTLSLFPAVYTKPRSNAPTPRMSPNSTPMRSRAGSRTNSVLRQSSAAPDFPLPPAPPASAHAPLHADQSQGDQKIQSLGSRLSICQET